MSGTTRGRDVCSEKGHDWRDYSSGATSGPVKCARCGLHR